MKRHLGLVLLTAVGKMRFHGRQCPSKKDWKPGNSYFLSLLKARLHFLEELYTIEGTKDLGFDSNLQVIASLWHLLITN